MDPLACLPLSGPHFVTHIHQLLSKHICLLLLNSPQDWTTLRISFKDWNTPSSRLSSLSNKTDTHGSQHVSKNTPLPSAEQPAAVGTDEIPGPSGIQNMRLNPSGRKRPASQPSFYKTYEAHAERRTAVLESLVRPDLERWRRQKEADRSFTYSKVFWGQKEKLLVRRDNQWNHRGGGTRGVKFGGDIQKTSTDISESGHIFAKVGTAFC